MSLLQFLRILMARRFIILATALSCFLAAAVVSQVLPKRYQATARIMLDLVKPDPVTGEVLPSKSLWTYAATQTQLIKDYQTAGIVVDRLGWTANPALVAQYNASGATSDMDIRRWLAQRIMDNTAASLLSGSEILTITFTGNSPEEARQIVDQIRSAYLDEALRRRRQEATRVADWYEEQTNRALAALQAAVANRSNFARANGIVLQGDSEADLEGSKLQALSQQSALAGVMSAPTAASGPSLSASMQLDAINQQIAQAAGTLGPNHPNYRSLLRQREVMQANAAREAARGGASAGGISLGLIERAYEIQKSRVLADRDKQDRLSQLQREMDLRREQYTKSAQRLADLRLESNAAGSNMSILGDASGTSTPSFPNIPLILGGALGLGFGLGLLIALLVELLARRVRGEDDLEYAAKAPVFAIVTNRRPDGPVRGFVKKVGRGRARQSSGELVEA